MIILNLCKESSEIIHYVLQKKSLAPILYTEEIRNLSKYCEIVLHSLQQHMNCVIHSGYHSKLALFFQSIFAAYRSQNEVQIALAILFPACKSPMKANEEKK